MTKYPMTKGMTKAEPALWFLFVMGYFVIRHFFILWFRSLGDQRRELCYRSQTREERGCLSCC